ncbi:MAG: type II secretion system protein GspG [Candidatus Omnitrophica bacterium]|nr:type II secretion system protein GspG [Candidatus Omnitrophota bacterium]
MSNHTRVRSSECGVWSERTGDSALRTPNSALRWGFTLVELLVVIAILGILISLVTAGAQAARRRGAVTKAKTMVSALETAIAMYQSDMGDYPESGNEGLVAALEEDPGDVAWDGPYLEFKEEEIEDGQLMDPWGQPYVYVSVNGGSPEHRERSYDLYSLGPNQQDDSGTGDDIYNW